MSLKVTIRQLQNNLPEILNRAVRNESVHIVEGNGQDVAVIISAREWRRLLIGRQLDALGADYRLSKDKQRRTEELLSKSKQTRLTRQEQQELNALLREADAILLRRATVLTCSKKSP
jgi:prevent-host-death family protein